MINVSGESCGSVWVKYMKSILQDGDEIRDGSEIIIEGPAATLKFVDFKNPDPILKRYANLGLLDAYRQKLFSTHIVSPFKYSYGQRLFDHNGINQIEWLKNLLLKKRESKSASVSLLSPNEKPDAVPCLVNLMCKIRAEKLLLTCVFRSQNALKSFANYIALRELQDKIAEVFRIESGPLISFVHSPHIYADDHPIVAKIIKGHDSEI